MQRSELVGVVVLSGLVVLSSSAGGQSGERDPRDAVSPVTAPPRPKPPMEALASYVSGGRTATLRAALLRSLKAVNCQSPSTWPELPTTASQVTTSSGLVMRRIPAGIGCMGCTPGQSGECVYNEEPAVAVAITRDFLLMEEEVSQAEWGRYMQGANPSYFQGKSDSTERPVECVSWELAVEFANAVSRLEGLKECYQVTGKTAAFVGLDCPGYRLPTEAEWEYAARAGQDLRYPGSNDPSDVGWWDSNTDETHPGGQLAANRWGLRDMAGNVLEYVGLQASERGYLLEPYQHAVDPLGPHPLYAENQRGGGFSCTYDYGRVASRYGCSSFSSTGLRLARSLP